MKRPHWLESIHHDSSSCYVDFAHKRIGAKVRLKLRASLDAPIEQIYVRLCPDGEQSMIPMHYLSSDEVCQWWQTEIELSMPLVGYRFFLITKEGSWHLNAAGITRYTPTDSSDFKLITCQSSNTPDWIHECVFYQIFPDRFADSQRIDNVKNGEYSYSGKPVISRSWGELPNKLTGGREFFGGDLYGIIERLDYLQELGINAIYLNPIFTAPSNHKYDTQDYFQVDPYLGKEEALIALRIALDKRKMRLMLDIVLNHCGATNQWFTDAQQDSSSETADFFTFYEHPNNYACWLGISTLPKLNYRSEKLRELIYSGQHSVLRYWLRPPYRIDGWRIDVANMLARQGESQLGHKIGRGIRRAVKEEFPEAYLLGEHFHDGTTHLQGNELDASMNYRGFTFPLINWLGGFDIDRAFGGEWSENTRLSTEDMVAQWRIFMSVVPWQITSQQFNLLGSHDTPRIFTIVSKNENLAKVASTLLFTYPGVPCIYYGDEIGLIGGRDPDNRRCMIWERERWNSSLFEHYKKLIALHHKSDSIKRGGFQILHGEKETVAYLRESRNEKVVVVARRALDCTRSLYVRSAGIKDGVILREYFTGEQSQVSDGYLHLDRLPETGVQVWITD